MEMFRKD